MQIYFRSYCLYSFDQQRAFRKRYITRNLVANQQNREYNENDVKYRGNILTEK